MDTSMLPFCKPPTKKKRKAQFKPYILEDSNGTEPIALPTPEYHCYICGTTVNLQLHHVFNGANRKISEQYNMKVYLCLEHHTGNVGVHMNQELDEWLKREFQRNFLKLNKYAAYMRLIGKNYDSEVKKIDKNSSTGHSSIVKRVVKDALVESSKGKKAVGA